MKELQALDKILDSLLENDLNIKAGKDLKVINATIANANAVSSNIKTKIQFMNAQSKNLAAIKKGQRDVKNI